MCANKINYYDDKVLNIRKAIDRANVYNYDEALNICDLSSVERKLRLWQKKCPRIKPYYAVKCNDDPLIVQTLVALGTGFDCASRNELKQILDLGVNPERIIYANPCRPISHIDYAQKHQVLRLTVDNEFEIYKLFKHYSTASVIVRFKSDAKAALTPLGSKFGCDPDNDAAALMLLSKALDLSVTGTSFHVGSGCMEIEAYERAIETGSNIMKLGELLGFHMGLLDIGGGFPGCNDEEFEEISDIINSALDTHIGNKPIEIISEPGAFFVAAACTLICQIHAKREIRNAAGKLDKIMYYMNDGVFGSFNCVISYNQFIPPEHYLEGAEPLPTFKSLIWGPTCDAADKVSEYIQLPNLNPGDLIGFPNMGAYSVAIATSFNGFPPPKTIYFKAR